MQNQSCLWSKPAKYAVRTLRALDLWEIFAIYYPKSSRVTWWWVAVVVILTGRTQGGILPQLLKTKETAAPAHSFLYQLCGSCCPNPISLPALALQEPQPCRRSTGAGWSGKRRKQAFVPCPDFRVPASAGALCRRRGWERHGRVGEPRGRRPGLHWGAGGGHCICTSWIFPECLCLVISRSFDLPGELICKGLGAHAVIS